MSAKAGQLLWNRVRIASLAPGPSAPINTGLRQVNLAFNNSSVNEPPLGGRQPTISDIGLASRVQVIPMSPIAQWTNVYNQEPYLAADGYVYVIFNNLNEGAATDLNVLFWDPHTAIGPGAADTYMAQPLEA